MAKLFTDDVNASKDAQLQSPIVLIEIYLNLGTLRFAAYNSNVVFNTNTYTAKAITMGDVNQSAEGQINRISLGFDNVLSDMNGYFLQEDFYNKKIIIRRIWINPTSVLKKEDGDALLLETGDFLLLEQSGAWGADEYNELFSGFLENPSKITPSQFNISATSGRPLIKKPLLKTYTSTCNNIFGDSFCNTDGHADLTSLSILDGSVGSGSTDYFIDGTMTTSDVDYGPAYQNTSDVDNAYGAQKFNDFFYVASNTEGVKSFSIDEDAPSLTLVDTDDQGGAAYDVFVQDKSGTSLLFLANFSRGLDTYTIDGSANFTHVDNYSTSTNCHSVTADEKFIYTSDPLEVNSLESDGSGNLTFKDNAIASGTSNALGKQIVIINSGGDAGGGTSILVRIGYKPSAGSTWKWSYPFSGIETYTVDASGNLTAADSYTYPTDLTESGQILPKAICKNDNDIYVLKSGTPDIIDRFTIDASGNLTLEESKQTNQNEDDYSNIYTNGTKLYAAGTENVQVFKIESGSTLTQESSIYVGGYTYGMHKTATSLLSSTRINGVQIAKSFSVYNDDYWKYGSVQFWAKGTDVTYTTYVDSYDSGTSKVWFSVPFSFALDNTYSYNIYKGCSKTWKACGDAYAYSPSSGNQQNFNGFLHIARNTEGTLE